eukprot:11767412-Heterocapsa_arctica.AAC.1
MAAAARLTAPPASQRRAEELRHDDAEGQLRAVEAECSAPEGLHDLHVVPVRHDAVLDGVHEELQHDDAELALRLGGP